MESDLRKTIVIDFFGIPGSGKTTKSHQLAVKYRNNGKTVVEPSFDLDHRGMFLIRKIKKFRMTASIPLSIRTSIRRIVSINGYKWKNGKLNQIVNIATKIYAIKKYNGKVDYIIFDEGLAQAAISLSVNSDIPADVNYRMILSAISGTFELQLVGIRLEIDEALRRIAIRNSGDSRVEHKKTESERKRFMKRYGYAFNQINCAKDLDRGNIINSIPVYRGEM